MTDNNNDDSFQRVINYQRRSVSVGDAPLQITTDDQPQTCDDKQSTDYNQYITQSDDDGYICALLPRTNHRPTAKTCWLVFMFSPLYHIFPIIR